MNNYTYVHALSDKQYKNRIIPIQKKKKTTLFAIHSPPHSTTSTTTTSTIIIILFSNKVQSRLFANQGYFSFHSSSVDCFISTLFAVDVSINSGKSYLKFPSVKPFIFPFSSFFFFFSTSYFNKRFNHAVLIFTFLSFLSISFSFSSPLISTNYVDSVMLRLAITSFSLSLFLPLLQTLNVTASLSLSLFVSFFLSPLSLISPPEHHFSDKHCFSNSHFLYLSLLSLQLTF